jgi:hypothetical protein
VTRGGAAACAPALLGALDFGFLAVAAPVVAADLDLGSAYAWLFSAGSLAYGAVVMPAEALLARIAAGRLLAAALAVAAAGIATLAVADGVAGALAGRVLFGAGTGAAAAPALVLLAREDAFAWMGGAIALGFSAGVILGATISWRPALTAMVVVAATASAAARVGSCRADSPQMGALTRPARAASSCLAPSGLHRDGSRGGLRLGAATVATGGCLAALPSEPIVATAGLATAAALAGSGWRALGTRLPDRRSDLVAACAAGAATTMSGVGATVLVGRRLAGTPSPHDELLLALFGMATLLAVRAAEDPGGSWRTARSGLAVQAVGILLVGSAPALGIAVFGAGHVLANAATARAAMGASGGAMAAAAGLFATAQYVAAAGGALLMVSVGEDAGLRVAAAIAILGAVAAGRR